MIAVNKIIPAGKLVSSYTYAVLGCEGAIYGDVPNVNGFVIEWNSLAKAWDDITWEIENGGHPKIWLSSADVGDNFKVAAYVTKWTVSEEEKAIKIHEIQIYRSEEGNKAMQLLETIGELCFGYVLCGKTLLSSDKIFVDGFDGFFFAPRLSFQPSK